MPQAGREERRRLRRGGKRRRRGGDNRAPMVVQRVAETVERTAEAAREVAQEAGEAARGGDRPLIAGVLVVAFLAVVSVSGPLQNYLDVRGRVDTLRAQADALGEANGQLRQQARDLEDPEHIELLAREEYGYVRPGQVAYVIVPPETDRPRITEPVETEQDDRSWWERLWDRAVG